MRVWVSVLGSGASTLDVHHCGAPGTVAHTFVSYHQEQEGKEMYGRRITTRATESSAVAASSASEWTP